MLLDSSSASAVTASIPSPGARRRFPAISMIRVRLSVANGTVARGEKGSRLLVTDSTTSPLVESELLNKTGRLACAEAVFKRLRLFWANSSVRMQSTKTKRDVSRLRHLFIESGPFIKER